jgi:Arc/MetJ family transcription regulator
MYNQWMSRRTTVVIDDALLHQAQGALGTTGVKDTVEKAFREAIRRHLRDRLAERIEAGTGVDRSPELLAESRPVR